MKDIKVFADQLKQEEPEVFQFGGFGYCAYASRLLQKRLAENGIHIPLLLGEYLTHSSEAEKCRKYSEKLILSFPDDGGARTLIKDAFVKRGGHLLARTGHVVLCREETIFDITSGQFNLPEIYPFVQFEQMWKKLYSAEVIVDKKEEFGIKEIKKRAYNRTPAY